MRFFEDEFPYNMIIKSVPTRLVSIACCVVFFVVMVISATNIQPQTNTEQFLPDNHPFQRNVEINNGPRRGSAPHPPC